MKRGGHLLERPIFLLRGLVHSTALAAKYDDVEDTDHHVAEGEAKGGRRCLLFLRRLRRPLLVSSLIRDAQPGQVWLPLMGGWTGVCLGFGCWDWAFLLL